jgi:hypothetical protein
MGAAVLTPERMHSMPRLSCAPQSVTVEIGDIPILLKPTRHLKTSRAGLPRSSRGILPAPEFCELLEGRYAGFLNPDADPTCQFEIQLDAKGLQGTLWSFQRGDFHATWDARARRGHIRQCPNPYSIDTVLRITHSLVLAEEGGFLVHAASAIRNKRAYLFAGVSGAGKTTMARLAPPDATVLTDEISYVRRIGNRYKAYGTPFAGELARVGANTSAPLETLYLLVQGPENRITPVPKIDAARALMRHVLFFAEEKEMVARVFDSVLEFVSHIDVAQLVFTPDARAWEMIR